MLTHPKPTVRLLCKLTQIHSPLVALLRAALEPPNIVSAVGLAVPGVLMLHSAPYF